MFTDRKNSMGKAEAQKKRELFNKTTLSPKKRRKQTVDSEDGEISLISDLKEGNF